jgi:chromosome segregation ATPase
MGSAALSEDYVRRTNVALPWTRKDMVFSVVVIALGAALASAIGIARDARAEHDRVSGELEHIRTQYAELGSDLVSAEKRAIELTDDLNRAYNGTLELTAIGTELEGSLTESISATMGIGRNISRLTETVDELERTVRVYQEIIRGTEQENVPP